MLLAQCDAVISLVDDTYYTRAWCSVETIMAQTLRKSWGIHLWYEYVPLHPSDNASGFDAKWILRKGPMAMEIEMAKKELTYEEDRPKVLFLERQSKLLG